LTKNIERIAMKTFLNEKQYFKLKHSIYFFK
jgi:hypothetical protein